MKNNKLYLIFIISLIVVLLGGYFVSKSMSGEDEKVTGAVPASDRIKDVEVYGFNEENVPTRAPEEWLETYSLEGILVEKPKLISEEQSDLVSFKLSITKGGDAEGIILEVLTPSLPYGREDVFYVPNQDQTDLVEAPLDESLSYYANRIGRLVEIEFKYGIDKTSAEGVFSEIMHGDDSCDPDCFRSIEVLYNKVDTTLESIETIKERPSLSNGKKLYILINNIRIK